jgi:predicted nucleic acid-binding protein
VSFVLDASIAACWCFHDEHDARADAALDLLETKQALVPVQWWFELRNVVLLGERHNRVTEQYTIEFLDTLERLPIELAALPDREGVLTIARKHRLTFYDAAYLELAWREAIPLATLDRALARAARAEGVALIEAS